VTIINRGFTFTDGVPDQCSYTALNALVDNATVTAIGLAEFANECHVTILSATTPASDQGPDSTWFDTTLNLYRLKTSDGWHTALLQDVKNNTGSTIPRGSFCILNGPNSVVPGATYQWGGIAGVLTATLTNGSRGPYLRRTGFTPVLCLAPVTLGDTLVLAGSTFTSYAAGYAVSRDRLGFTGVTMGIEIGMARGSLTGTSTGLVTALLYI
jgi:hypothetical protein